MFEIYVDAADGPMQLCGGGRYDDLARALGSRDVVPACGFQIGLERLNLALPALATVAQPRVLVVGVTPQDHTVALALASELRSIDRVVVEQDVRLRGVKAALRHADRADIDLVVIIGERERAEGIAVLRDMRSREETQVLQTDLCDAVQKALT